MSTQGYIRRRFRGAQEAETNLLESPRSLRRRLPEVQERVFRYLSYPCIYMRPRREGPAVAAEGLRDHPAASLGTSCAKNPDAEREELAVVPDYGVGCRFPREGVAVDFKHINGTRRYGSDVFGFQRERSAALYWNSSGTDLSTPGDGMRQRAMQCLPRHGGRGGEHSSPSLHCLLEVAAARRHVRGRVVVGLPVPVLNWPADHAGLPSSSSPLSVLAWQAQALASRCHARP